MNTLKYKPDKLKLNLGCGRDLRAGYVNLDFVKLPGIDVAHNLNKYPWPFKDNRFEVVYCDNVLEHLEDIIKPVEEIWRISKNRGRTIIKVPIFPSIWAMVDPTHKQFFTYYSFDCFTPGDTRNYYSKARFKILQRKILFGNWFFNWVFNINDKAQKFYSVYLAFIIPAGSLYFELETVK